MYFKIVPGKNKKIFAVIEDITTKQDLEIYEAIKKVLYRKEFKPFKKGFSKWVEATYLFNFNIFPHTFLFDVVKVYTQLSGEEPVIINGDVLINQEIDEQEFYDYIRTCKFPEDIDVISDKYQFQQKIVYSAIYNKTGYIDVAMSGGKTFITYMYCRYMYKKQFLPKDKRILIVVPSKTLANQLQSDFKHYDKYFERKLFVETIYANSKKLMYADVVCGTFQSLSNYEQDYFDDFGVMICDEMHRAKSNSIRNEIYAKMMHCEYYFGMTGTLPEYNSLDYLNIVLIFGQELFKQTMIQNIESGISTPVEIHEIQINYVNNSDFAENLIENGIVGIEKLMTEKQFFHNYEPRTMILAKLLNNIPENSIIMTDTIEYCYILKEFLEQHCPGWKFKVIHGIIKDRDGIIQEMRDTENKFSIIGNYACISTGISIKNLENIYLVDSGKSKSRFKQATGRGMRLFPTKEVCKVFDFQDMMYKSIFKNHSKIRSLVFRKEKLKIITHTVNI